MILTPIFSSSPDIVISIEPVYFYEGVLASSGTTVGEVTISISGGVPPYTAVWTSSDVEVVATDPTATTSTTFDWINLAALLDTVFADHTITVTDSSGNTAEYRYTTTISRIG